MLEPCIDVPASVASWRRQWEPPVELVKLPEDLSRYEAVIAAGRPDVLVECGTWRGASARWFAGHGLRVITVDRTDNVDQRTDDVTWILGDSSSPDVAAQVAGFVGRDRCMVVLDSDHRAGHVAAEIKLYGPLVSKGCHLVVEDGIVRWLDDPRLAASGPLEAIDELLAGNPDWQRDIEVESMYSVSMHPCGWWRRI
jgi:cephalosporin hydroxylase